jgi:hypothetical protein
MKRWVKLLAIVARRRRRGNVGAGRRCARRLPAVLGSACTGSCGSPLIYRIGVSQDSITVPVGFVPTSRASPAIAVVIRANGLYIPPAVVHDYLYWKQAYARAG